MTVGSFTSISLDPPLVGFFADCGSSTLARVQAGGSFCVNVLTDSQHHLCGVFAAREIGRAHVCTPVTNAHLVYRLLLEKKKKISSINESDMARTKKSA